MFKIKRTKSQGWCYCDKFNLVNECASLTYLPKISNWNLKRVSDISNLFSGCSSLISLPDISNWDTTNVENMSLVFAFCSSLTFVHFVQNKKN